MSKENTIKGTVQLESQAAFDEINKRVQNDPDLVKRIGSIVLFEITRDGELQKCWTIDGNQRTIYEGKPKHKASPQVTITLDDKDFIRLFSGKTNPPALFAKGKLKIKGNIMLAQKVSALFKEQSKL